MLKIVEFTGMVRNIIDIIRNARSKTKDDLKKGKNRIKKPRMIKMLCFSYSCKSLIVPRDGICGQILYPYATIKRTWDSFQDYTNGDSKTG